MTDYWRFKIADGRNVLVDMDQVTTIWESKSKGATILEMFGSEHMIDVAIDFHKFINDYVDYVDMREREKKPRKKRGSPKLSAARKPS